MKRNQATNPSLKAENLEAVKRNQDKHKAKQLEARKKKIRPRHVTHWSPIKISLLQRGKNMIKMTMGWFLVDWITLHV